MKGRKEIIFSIWREGEYYASQCLNVNVSSFGETIEEAKNNLREAVELYFENENFVMQKEIPYGTFSSILKQTGTDIKGFKKILKSC